MRVLGLALFLAGCGDGSVKLDGDGGDTAGEDDGDTADTGETGDSGDAPSAAGVYVGTVTFLMAGPDGEAFEGCTGDVTIEIGTDDTVVGVGDCDAEVAPEPLGITFAGTLDAAWALAVEVGVAPGDREPITATATGGVEGEALALQWTGSLPMPEGGGGGGDMMAPPDQTYTGEVEATLQ